MSYTNLYLILIALNIITILAVNGAWKFDDTYGYWNSLKDFFKMFNKRDWWCPTLFIFTPFIFIPLIIVTIADYISEK